METQHSIQYWGWPASLMRAVTAAYAEEKYFEKGKVAASGGSKNGASPSISIIHDIRITALHATVSPISESPLRLCDDTAWDALRKYEAKQGNYRSAIRGIFAVSGLLNKIKIGFITFLNNLEIVDKEQISQNKSEKSGKNEKVVPRKMKRNEPCYCNSGKKYKHCHGAL